MKSLLTATLFAALASTSALAGAGHSGDDRAYGEPGTADHPARILRIDMKETADGMTFNPKKFAVHKGEQIRFVISNVGEFDHELVLGTLEENLGHAEEMAKNPDMEHDDPNAIRLAPNGKGEILWMFTKAGEFDFSCLLPGHRESGMFGTIIVQ
ncbi:MULTISPECIES: cupredoxin family protein [unclassified Devosia]|uniref:cupredoxin domain-containing protein n=1 Tax=unclassified Devosia TaxID=196773 RepID=UPI00086EC0EF|nr:MULTISPECIES: cupredoxin family protein [unclassified Devosia]ODS87917.1 MAG: copper resistance protein [Devosia sp. SCN 66-27]OJX22693.1 MAG: copper resistance protein [Devosia sp. 66-14]